MNQRRPAQSSSDSSPPAGSNTFEQVAGPAIQRCAQPCQRAETDAALLGDAVGGGMAMLLDRSRHQRH